MKEDSVHIIKRPHIVYRTPFEILGIFVLDGSGSMVEQTARGWTKADTVSMAVSDVLSWLKYSRNKNGFSFAIVNYDHRSVVKLKPIFVKDIEEYADYNPMEGLGGATYISEGLKDAKMIAEEFLYGGSNRHVVVMLMTGGVDMTRHKTVPIANAIKRMENVSLAGCFFETVGADTSAMIEYADFVQSLCSSPDDFRTVDDYLSLREFFFSSISNRFHRLF